MATDYYPPTEDTETTPAANGSDGADSEQGAESVGETALVPKTILAGKELQPGDTVTFKVVHLYDDEIELQPVSEGKETETETEPEGMSANAEIDAMAAMPMGKKGMM